MNLTFKKKKPLFYISFGLFAALSALIIVESSLDSGLSGLQSLIFAKISSRVIDEIIPPETAKLVKPTSIKLARDSSYLGEGQIAIGTTSLIRLEVEYPKDINKSKERYDYTYTFDKYLGNDDDYNIIFATSTNNNMFYIDMRVVANNLSPDIYQINVDVAETKSFSYQFHIVDLPAPTNYETKLDVNTIKVGGTTTIDTKLTGEDHDDTYLRRYFDVTKLTYSSLDESVATIDKYGVIHGINPGTTTVKYGKDSYQITVSNETITKPATNNINIAKSSAAKNNMSLLDYDYINTNEDDPNDYSILLYPSFEDNTLEDQSVRWETTNQLIGKIAPYKYDDNGYPVYKDEDNKYCVRVCGYRLEGDVSIRCISNADNTIYKDINLYSGEAIAESFEIKTSKTGSIAVNEQFTISATFSPKNTHNTKIRVIPSDDKMCQVINDTTEVVTVKALKMGKCSLQIESISNDHLKANFEIEFTAQKKINDENFSDFHGFIRKFAGHFALFMVTAIFGTMFFYLFIEDIKKLWLSFTLSMAAGFFLAGLSEFIQHFLPSRGGTMLDVGIDSLGYVIGAILTIGVILLIRLISKKIKQKKENKANE